MFCEYCGAEVQTAQTFQQPVYTQQPAAVKEEKSAGGKIGLILLCGIICSLILGYITGNSIGYFIGFLIGAVIAYRVV